MLTDIDYTTQAVKKYTKAVTQGRGQGDVEDGHLHHPELLRRADLRGLGLSQEFIDSYFTVDPVPHRRHRDRRDRPGSGDAPRAGLPDAPDERRTLDPGGDYQWRQDGEHHLLQPADVHNLQQACRTNDYEAFQEVLGADQ